MTDARLAGLLGKRMSIYGSSGGPDRNTIDHQAAELMICASWEGVLPREPPIFVGASTVRMARYIYSIADPDQAELTFSL